MTRQQQIKRNLRGNGAIKIVPALKPDEFERILTRSAFMLGIAHLVLQPSKVKKK